MRNRIKSFKHAFTGISTMIKDEPNARIHLVVAVLVVVFGGVLKISAFEWMFILLAVGIVISAEAFNSALENLADVVSPEFHPSIKKVKDLGAAAVLICSLVAAVIGGIIFIPKILLFF
ncbi:MAG: diacylglycerol kinase family protein [Cryomorphaceae bacterium]|nr:diacylglycerol kinase family protein [Cryomorphaceae bacterium]